MSRETLPRNVKIISETGVEVLLTIEVPDLPVRQRQIQDFHRLMGHYPADRVKLDVAGSLGVDVTQFSPEEKAAYEQAARVAEEMIAASIQNRNAGTNAAPGAQQK